MRPTFAFATLALVCLACGVAQAQDAAPAPDATSVPPSELPQTSVELEPEATSETDPATEESEAGAEGEDVVTSIGTAIGAPDLAAQGELEQAVEHRIVWREEWPRFSFDEAALSVGLALLLVAAELLPTGTTTPNWAGGNPFDSAVRDGLRLQLYEQRESARIAGDVLMWVSVGFPFVVDAFAVVGLGDSSWDTALQMGLIGLEAYVVSLTIWRITALLARRERPLGMACREGDISPHCDTRAAHDQVTQSFFSNTAVNAFTGAGLTCLHHTVMPIFADEAADATACVGAITVASVAGLLRVMSDFEYLTDVLAGAAVGFLSGYFLPWLLHYQGGARPELRSPVAMVPLPMVGPGDTYGVDVVGWF